MAKVAIFFSLFFSLSVFSNPALTIKQDKSLKLVLGKGWNVKAKEDKSIVITSSSFPPLQVFFSQFKVFKTKGLSSQQHEEGLKKAISKKNKKFVLESNEKKENWKKIDGENIVVYYSLTNNLAKGGTPVVLTSGAIKIKDKAFQFSIFSANTHQTNFKEILSLLSNIRLVN